MRKRQQQQLHPKSRQDIAKEGKKGRILCASSVWVLEGIFFRDASLWLCVHTHNSQNRDALELICASLFFSLLPFIPKTVHKRKRRQKKGRSGIMFQGHWWTFFPSCLFSGTLYVRNGIVARRNHACRIYSLLSLHIFFKCRLFPALEIYFFCFLFYSTMNWIRTQKGEF